MKTTKAMFDKELQPLYYQFKILGFVISKTWGIRLFNCSVRKLKGKNIQGLSCEERYIPSKNNGPDIRVRIFRPVDAEDTLPGLLYNHGGGYMLDGPEVFLDYDLRP